MQSLYSTFIFAVLSDRALIVDWRPQPKSHTCYVHDLFDLPDFDWSYKLIRPLLDDSIIDEHSIRLAFDDPLLLDPFLCANVSEYYHAVPVINIHTDEYYAPMFEHGYYRDTLREVFGDREMFTQLAPFLFRMREEIQRDMEQFERENFGEEGCALGLQVRQDGIAGVNGTKDGLTTKAVHWSCGQQVLEDRSDLTGKIFLAADVQKIRDEANEMFGDRIVFYPVPVRHQEQQTCDEVKAALIDLMMLARCKALVVSSWSSLGAVAHSISGVKPMIAIHKTAGASEVSSIKESEGTLRNYCHQIDWSRPCFFEWVHARHLSCFSTDMFNDEPCCELGFCEDCLHHERLAVKFLAFYHWPASKILFTLILITFTSYGTYRSLLWYFIRRNNYRAFARNIALGVLAIATLVWFLLVTIVRGEYHRNMSKQYLVDW
jgi:hypothetical protein